MGLLAKAFAAKMVTKAIGKMKQHDRAAEAAARGGQYIPANDAVAVPSTSMRGRAGSMVDHANAIYRRNPKLVSTVGMGLVTVLLASWAKKRHLI